MKVQGKFQPIAGCSCLVLILYMVRRPFWLGLLSSWFIFLGFHMFYPSRYFRAQSLAFSSALTQVFHMMPETARAEALETFTSCAQHPVTADSSVLQRLLLWQTQGALGLSNLLMVSAFLVSFEAVLCEPSHTPQPALFQPSHPQTWTITRVSCQDKSSRSKRFCAPSYLLVEG